MALTDAPRACRRFAHWARLPSIERVVVAMPPRIESRRSIGESSSDGAGSLAACTPSSVRMSLHNPMHSSQMYTPGPAISFLTILLVLEQNEHEMTISSTGVDTGL